MSKLPVRFQTLGTVADEVRSLPGSVAEVGVWRGKGAHFMAQILPNKTIHLFDTFSGMPPESLVKLDGDHWAIYANNSLKAVRRFLSRFDNFEFHVGEFPGTGSELAPKEKFCLVNVDVDIYHPTYAACEFFYPRLVTGGIMVLNDYRASKCKGATAAVNEFFEDKPEEIVYGGRERTFLRKL
jgi:O-methyltransferase